MKFYKIIHKPTGLFFTPSKGRGNFSTTGKVYTKKPNLDWVTSPTIKIYFYGRNPNKKERKLIEHFKLKSNRNLRMILNEKSIKITNMEISKTIKTERSDWEIIEYDGTEISNNSKN